MSALGQKRTWPNVPINVCFTPKSGHRSARSAYPLSANSGSRPASVDDLVGACEQRRWYIDAERPRGLQIDDEFELGRLHDRQIGRIGALENFAGVSSSLFSPFRAATMNLI
jgi:hypothetical protein